MSPIHHSMAAGSRPTKRRKWPIPDGAAGGVAVHADAPAGEVFGPADRAAPANVEIARGEIAQGEHGQADVAPIALLDAVEVLRHRPLTALHGFILHGAAQHLGARRPRSAAAQDHRERDALRLHLAGRERHDAGIVCAGERDLDVGHLHLLDHEWGPRRIEHPRRRVVKSGTGASCEPDEARAAWQPEAYVRLGEPQPKARRADMDKRASVSEPR